jgi:hypothetical protein
VRNGPRWRRYSLEVDMKAFSLRCAVICTWVGLLCGGVDSAEAGNLANLIPNGDFSAGELGGLPESWTAYAARPVLAPRFALVEKSGRKLLQVAGAGHDDCAGHLGAKAPVARGETYRFHVVFKVSDGLDPHRHLLFQCFGPGANDGIFALRRPEDGWIEGETGPQLLAIAGLQRRHHVLRTGRTSRPPLPEGLSRRSDQTRTGALVGRRAVKGRTCAAYF